MSNLKIDVTADVNKAKQNLKDTASAVSAVSTASDVASTSVSKVERSLKDAASASADLSREQSSLSRVLTSVPGIIGMTTAAVAAMTAVSKDLIDTYKVQEQAEVRLEATLKATGATIGMTSKELKSLASSFQEVTTFGDEAIIEVEKLFVASGAISKDVMPKATEAVLDMAAAMGEDLTSSAKRLAKALADPKSNLDALKDANLQLSDAQKEQIKQLQEQGDLLGAQSIILQKVEDSYGGIARALADTDTGKLTQIANIYGDIKEGLGSALLNSISPALDLLYGQLVKIQSWMSRTNTASSVISRVKAGEMVDYSMITDDDLESLYTTVKSWSNNPAYHDKQYASEALDDIKLQLISRRYGIDVSLLSADQISELNSAWSRVNDSRWAEAMDLGMPKGAPTTQMLNDFASAHKGKQMSLFDYWYYREGEMTFEDYARAYPLIKQSASQATVAGNPETQTILPTNQISTQSYISLSDSFLSKNLRRSKSAQISNLDAQIAEAYSAYWSTGDKNKQQQIQEVISSLKLEKQALLDVKEAEVDVEEASVDTWSSVRSVISPVQNLLSSVGDLFSTFADKAEASLNRIEDKWNKYFDDLDRKQTSQQNTYSALLSAGEISYDDYIAAMNKLDEERADAVKQQQEEESAARDEANRLGEAAFNAKKVNSLASIAISTAEAIMGTWADDPNPITAGIITGIISAASLAQIASVSAQSYTPLAAGGITQGPQRALVGEGGAKELILPLTEANLKKVGLKDDSNGTIIINISVEGQQSKEDLTESIFHAIERAQRTGALPKWRYA